MAKISARGEHKLSEASFAFGDGWTRFYVLRSDGAILAANAYTAGETAYDRRRGNYAIRANLKSTTVAKGDAEMRAAFQRYVEHKALALSAPTGVTIKHAA